MAPPFEPEQRDCRPLVDADAAAYFLELLYGVKCPGFVALWTKQDRETHWYPASNLAAIAEGAARLAPNKDCYFGIGVQERPLGRGHRGEAETVIAIPGLWFDFDIKGSAHAETKLPENLDIALEFIAGLPLTPSVIVNSGHGLQLWWLFRQPWVFQSDEERHQAVALALDWQRLVLRAGAARGWRLDNTAGLARVFRLPGTLNHKGVEKGFAEQPVLASVMKHQPNLRFDSGDFIPFLKKPAGGDEDPPTDDPDNGANGSAAVEPIVEGCAWLRHCRDDADRLPEPEWIAMLSIVGRCENGDALAHQWSKPYPDYTAKETDAKLRAALGKTGPWTCEQISDKAGGEPYCSTCQHRSKIKSPIVLGAGLLRRVVEQYVYVVGVKRFVDLRTLQFLDKEQFSDLLADKIRAKSGAAKLALSMPQLIKLDGITFAPGSPTIVEEEGERRLNMWRAPDVIAAEGDVEPFLSHLSYVIPDPAAREHILDFMAVLLQRPGEKIDHAVLLIGEQGTGKTFLAKAMEIVLGSLNVVTVDPAELQSDFNGWLKNAQLVVIEEMMAFGRRELMNKLKPLITQSRVRINEKFALPCRIPNRANFMMFSNHQDAVLLEDGDRRYFVYTSPAQPRNQAYYDELFCWLSNNGPALLHWLEARDLSRFNPHGRAPGTEAKLALIEASRSPLDAYLEEALKADEWPFTGDLAVASHIADALGTKFRASVTAVAASLKRLGGVRLGQKRMRDGTKPAVWAMRRPELWQQADEGKIADEYERTGEVGGRQRWGGRF
jgi:hypothetical protein